MKTADYNHATYLKVKRKSHRIRAHGAFVYRAQTNINPTETVYKGVDVLTIEKCNTMRYYTSIEAKLSGSTAEEVKDDLMVKRKGMIGASSVGNIVGCGIGSHREYWKFCIGMHNLTDPFVGNAHTERGTRLEGKVVSMYERMTGNKVLAGNHWHMRRYPMFASSPDGKVLLADRKQSTALEFDGGLEAKTKLGYTADTIPKAHMAQLQWQMMTACMAFVDYISVSVDTNEDVDVKEENAIIIRAHASLPYFRWMCDIVVQFKDSIFNGTPIPDKLPSCPRVEVQRFLSRDHVFSRTEHWLIC